jgi:hypothetical protein
MNREQRRKIQQRSPEVLDLIDGIAEKWLEERIKEPDAQDKSIEELYTEFVKHIKGKQDN